MIEMKVFNISEHEISLKMRIVCMSITLLSLYRLNFIDFSIKSYIFQKLTTKRTFFLVFSFKILILFKFLFFYPIPIDLHMNPAIGNEHLAAVNYT